MLNEDKIMEKAKEYFPENTDYQMAFLWGARCYHEREKGQHKGISLTIKDDNVIPHQDVQEK